MKAAVLFSGGKDSCLALHKANENGYSIKYLLTVLPESKDSYMYHKPNLRLLKKQAESLNIPLILQKSKNEKEKELEDLRKLLKKVIKEIDVLVIGGIASNYQGKRIGEIAEELGIEIYAPLWDYTPEMIWKELFMNDFKVVLTKIACEGIPKEFLGKIIRKKEFEELLSLSKKHNFRLDFEGGEAESAVLFMPEFIKEIKITGKIISDGKFRYFFDIEKVW